jgi:hypothetical protein
MASEERTQGPDPARPLAWFADGDAMFTPTVTPLTTRLGTFIGPQSGTLLTTAFQALFAQVALRRDTRYKYALIRESNYGHLLSSAAYVAMFQVFDTKEQAKEYAATVVRDWKQGADFPDALSFGEAEAKAKAIRRSGRA